MKRTYLLPPLIASIFITILEANTCNYYISTTGSDGANGTTLNTPFKTLEKARDTIRQLKIDKQLPQDGITVCLREGNYPREKSFELKNMDSGREGQPITYQAYKDEKVTIHGAKTLNSDWFKLLSKGSRYFNRLNRKAQGKVYSINLKKHHIRDYGELTERGFGQIKVSAMELFANGQPMTLSRWPDRDKNQVVKQNMKRDIITLYGKSSPSLQGRYRKYKHSDGVNSYKREGLIEGKQYFLYRHKWNYQGQSYTAWFLTTDYGRYPRTNEPFFAEYNLELSNLTKRNGAEGNLLTKRVGAINHGYAIIRDVTNKERTFKTYNRSKLERWEQAEDLWFHGFWKNSWSDLHLKGKVVGDKITLSHKPTFGMKKGQYYYAENLLEEITQPTEWYLNREDGILYFYPEGDIKNQEIMISMIKEPLVKLVNSSYIRFQNITFEMSRANLMEISGKDNVVANSILKNVGNTAITIKGYNNRIDHCRIYHTGDSAIRILAQKEDKKHLIKSLNIVENNEIHHTSQWSGTSFPAVKIDESVGNIIRHNTLHHLPYSAILFEGNEHLIEYNEIHHTNQFSSDAGAIYIGRNWGWRGNTIRYNFIHDISTHLEGDGVHGIYLDDVSSGINIYRNIFNNIENYAIYTGGGRDNTIEQNIFVNCSAFHTDCRGTTAINHIKNDSWNFLERLNQNSVNYQRGIWKSKYPLLAKIPNSWKKITSDFYPDHIYRTKEHHSKWLYPEGTKFIKNKGFNNKIWIHDQCKSVSYKESFAKIKGNQEHVTALGEIEMSLNTNSSLFSLEKNFKHIGPLTK
jgi:hypothetical protein